MTPKEKALELYSNELTTKLEVKNIDSELLNKIVVKLGIAAYSTTSDSSKVSGNDQTEKDVVIAKLLVRDLGMTDATSEALNAIVNDAIAVYGVSNPRKYRVPLYYMIITKLNKVEEYKAL